MSVLKHLKIKPKETKFAQVEMDPSFHATIKAALKEDRTTFQDVLEAGLKSYLEERKKKSLK